jgi:hypothetical protein
MIFEHGKPPRLDARDLAISAPPIVVTPWRG